MTYEIVIGLETHAQLLTRSKMYCPCSADYADAEPNTYVCPICLGMPGVLPTINRQAVEYAVMTALALQCTIPEYTKFDRKNYPYPDLMKGYQISQYDAPMGKDGRLEIEVDGQRRTIGIERVHLEEDVAKLTHRSAPRRESYSLVDVNRSGVPLMEIVSRPDLRSPEEARQYLIKLRSILRYLGVSTGNMEEGSFRCDANISLRPQGSPEFLPKVEVKNMNSFRAVFRAMAYEAERQEKLLEAGEKISQETRGWVEEKGITVAQRSKEYAHDYRYFPEPDLPPLALTPAWVEELRAGLPELPEERKDRFMAQYGLPAYNARLLTNSRELADYFEECLRLNREATNQKRAKTVSNWLLGEFSRLLNATGSEIQESRVSPGHLVELLDLMDGGQLSGPAAKSVFEEMFHHGGAPAEIVAQKGLAQISQSSELEGVVEQVIAASSQAVADYRSGKGAALKFLVGQVMRQTKGRGNPQVVTELLRQKLGQGGD
ncbi:MAG: Asp-tRNA(Asn)/Glu-tRNA(Gln) amidotransferase subunit GatB [Dehalococcoidia bacterium]